MSKARDSENNVLSRLMQYRDPEGNPLPNELLRNEVMTLLLAGHETTSNLLTWTLWLLAKNPQWQEMAYKDLSEKRLTNCILESMRLFPPAPMISRCAKEDDVIMGYPIKAGTTVLALQWVTHRDERFWSDPLQFNPERFNSPLIHEYSYFPFARGPRSCIGEELAMRESIIILRTLINKFNFKLVPEFNVVPTHHITLRPKDGLKLELVAR
jgi:cytochrome P450